MPEKFPIATGHHPVTAGSLPADPDAVLAEINPLQQRTSRPGLWAVISGIAGFVANVLLMLFFLLGRPFEPVQNSFGWLGTANDWVIVVQFLTLIPVAVALPRWLPPTRSVRVATVIAVGAMLAVAMLQLALIAGVLGLRGPGVCSCRGVPTGLRMGDHRQLRRPPLRYLAALRHAFRAAVGRVVPARITDHDAWTAWVGFPGPARLARRTGLVGSAGLAADAGAPCIKPPVAVLHIMSRWHCASFQLFGKGLL